MGINTPSLPTALLHVLFWTSTAAALKLNVTAIGANHGRSTLECWQLDAPVKVATEPGIAGTAVASLGDASNFSISVLPPQFDGGLHNAPRNQWVVFTSGLAHITIPGNSSESSAYITGGEFGLIFAADTANVSDKGHRTQYPGLVETTALQIPTRNGQIPPHNRLHMGPCTGKEVGGLRAAR